MEEPMKFIHEPTRVEAWDNVTMTIEQDVNGVRVVIKKKYPSSYSQHSFHLNHDELGKLYEMVGEVLADG